MKLIYSKHWYLKKMYRSEITDDLIEYAIQQSLIIKDKHHEDVLNAVYRVPPMGRTLKVVYKQIGKQEIKIITAFWLD